MVEREGVMWRPLIGPSWGESEEDGCVGLRAMDGERVDRCGW